MQEAVAKVNQNEKSTQADRFLTFVLGNTVFGIDISFVTEIVSMQKISEIPQLPPFVKGIVNLRGNIIPIVDMRLRLKMKSAEYSDRTCIIVINVHSHLIGLIVDYVNEVVTIPDTSIVPPPAFNSNSQSRYIKGIDKDGESVRLLLDCSHLFNFSELETFDNINA